jgi:hypothetical protein
LKRIGIAVVVAAVLYGVGLGVGSLLYASGVIATGATHNDCEDFRKTIADRRGIDEEDVPQSEIKAEAEQCLAGHVLTEREAFRTEYLFWSAWPAAICAVIFLLWPAWASALRRQEEADPVHKPSRLDMGL